MTAKPDGAALARRWRAWPTTRLNFGDLVEADSGKIVLPEGRAKAGYGVRSGVL